MRDAKHTFAIGDRVMTSTTSGYATGTVIGYGYTFEWGDRPAPDRAPRAHVIVSLDTGHRGYIGHAGPPPLPRCPRGPVHAGSVR